MQSLDFNINKKMLSKFLLHSVNQGSKCMRILTARMSSSVSVPTSANIEIINRNYPARLENWENYKMPNAPYEGCGPLPPLPEYDESTTKHYIFPKTWFEFLYPRTGVTGPYVLFASVCAMLMSKEYYVMNGDTYYVAGFIITMTFLNSKIGPTAREFFEKVRVDRLMAHDQVKAWEIESLVDAVEDTRLEQWRAHGQQLINDARKSNLAMMLETEYLNRQATVVESVKRLLDYQVAVQKVETDLEQKHMVNWIQKKVQETITPETQKATLNACIAQLNAIAAKR